MRKDAVHGSLCMVRTCSTPSPGQHDSFDATLPRRPRTGKRVVLKKKNKEKLKYVIKYNL